MILTKFGFPRKIFIKVPNIKFHVNPSGGIRARACGQTDGHHEGSQRSQTSCSGLVGAKGTGALQFIWPVQQLSVRRYHHLCLRRT
jgi:hypothetical protein